MKLLEHLARTLLLAVIGQQAQAYTYFTCAGGSQMDFNSGHMTFNYADNLSADQKAAISLGHARLTEFSDSSITTVDNGDSDYSSGNGENEIYLDAAVGTASCTYWFNPSTCTVIEADMQYGNQPWTTTDDSQHYPYATGRSMTGTAVHEGGHCIGMAHTNNLYNMMGVEYSYVTRQGTDTYYGPGEDLSDGLIDLHGERSGGLDTYRDVGATVMRYAGFSGEYSLHSFGLLRDYFGNVKPVVGSYVGQNTYQVAAGEAVLMEVTLENNGEADVENPLVGFYLSDNDNISAADTFIAEIPVTLGRDAPLEALVGLSIPQGTAPGNYFLGVYVDHGNLIAETTVANNVGYYPVSVVSSAPGVTTFIATDILAWSATFNSLVNPRGLSTTVYYDYGTTTSYGSTVTHGNIGAGTSLVSAPTGVSGLDCETTYYYRARAQNSSGTALGAPVSFTTAACPPGCM